MPLSETEREDAVLEYQRLQREVNRRRYLNDIALWARERLGVHLWSGQRRIGRSVVEHRKTLVKSCHEVGKSFNAALIACWWIDVHLPGQAFVVTTAPTNPQVRAILWREINRLHAMGNLGGRTNQTEWHLTTIEGKEELVAYGRKPSDTDPTAFQGIHARYVLFIGDEACGLPESILEAADSLIANDNSKALLIGNPDDPESEFKKLAEPGSGYNVVTISAFDSPNFTGEEVPKLLREVLIGELYVEEKRKKWARQWYWNDNHTRVLPPADDLEGKNCHPFWHSKVLGQFPISGELTGTLIPMRWIRDAMERTYKPTALDVRRLGVDVGGGTDSSTVCEREGWRFRVVHEDRNPDTMQTTGNAVNALNEANDRTPDNQIKAVNVDMIGIGRGVRDRGRELTDEETGKPLPFFGVNVAEAASDTKRFMNLRAELWWMVREAFEAGLPDIDEFDEELVAELVQLRFFRTSSGKIQIESKADAKARGVSSPNRADSLMLTFADVKAKVKRKATWGKR